MRGNQKHSCWQWDHTRKMCFLGGWKLTVYLQMSWRKLRKLISFTFNKEGKAETGKFSVHGIRGWFNVKKSISEFMLLIRVKELCDHLHICIKPFQQNSTFSSDKTATKRGVLMLPSNDEMLLLAQMPASDGKTWEDFRGWEGRKKAC